MKKLIPIFLLVSLFAFGQGGVTSNAALKVTGGPAPGATIRVCTSTATGTPCSPLATIYSDNALSIAKTNPFTADANGNYSYFASPGLYKEQQTFGTSTHTSIVGIAQDAAYAPLNASTFAGIDACAKITAAITALPSTGGTIDATGFRGDQTCTLSSSLTIGSSTKPVRVMQGASRLILTGGISPAITIPSGSCWEGFSPLASRLNTQTSATGVQFTGSHSCLKNVLIQGTASLTKGILLQATGSTAIQSNLIDTVWLTGANTVGSKGIDLIADTAPNALVSFNDFRNTKVWDFQANIKLESTSTQGPTDNNFYTPEIGASSGAGTCGIQVTSGDINNFWGGFVAGKNENVCISSGVKFTSFHGTRLESPVANNINNAGTGTMFYGLSVDANSISDTGTKTTIMGQGNADVVQKLGQGTVQTSGPLQVLSTTCTGSLPCFSFSNDSNTGFWNAVSDHSVKLSNNGVYSFEWVSKQSRAASDALFGWTSTTDPTQPSFDTGLSRVSAGVVAVGNGTALDATGQLNMGAVKVGASGSTISDSRKLIQATYDCGTTTTCANTTNNSDWIVRGTVALGSASPSASTVASISPAFTSTATYTCTASPEGATAAIAAGGIAITKVSGSSITLTGPNTVTTVIDYICIGH